MASDRIIILASPIGTEFLSMVELSKQVQHMAEDLKAVSDEIMNGGTDYAGWVNEGVLANTAFAADLVTFISTFKVNIETANTVIGRFQQFTE